VAIALCLRSTRLVETSGTVDRSTELTDAGSSFIDMENQFANSSSIGSSAPIERTRRYFSAAL
jgi:hypothetical protein